MKILICIDVEGVTGVDDVEMLRGFAFTETRRLATLDLNAAIRGIRAAMPAAAIDVFDAHGMGGNLIEEDVEPGCVLLGGGWMTTLLGMVQSGDMARYDAAILLGQHAATGTVDGFMPHTNTIFTALRVNGKDAGEAEHVAWLLGHFGVPTLMVVGDCAAARAAIALLPGVTTVAVKQAASRSRAESLPLVEAHQLIEMSAETAVQDLSSRQPFRLEGPIDIELLLATEAMAETASHLPGFERRRARSVGATARNFVEGWRAYNVGRVVSRMHVLEEQLDMVRDVAEVETRLKTWGRETFRTWMDGPFLFPAVTYGGTASRECARSHKPVANTKRLQRRPE